MSGAGCRVQGVECRVWGVGCSLQGAGCGVQDVGFALSQRGNRRVQGVTFSGIRFQAKREQLKKV